MSRAEEQALKAYPKRGWKCKDAEGNDTFLDGSRECRLAYIKGYEQAEQDLMEFVKKLKEDVGIGICEYDVGFFNGEYEMLNVILEKLNREI